jgi:hypothetical protein
LAPYLPLVSGSIADALSSRVLVSKLEGAVRCRAIVVVVVVVVVESGAPTARTSLNLSRR